MFLPDVDTRSVTGSVCRATHPTALVVLVRRLQLARLWRVGTFVAFFSLFGAFIASCRPNHWVVATLPGSCLDARVDALRRFGIDAERDVDRDGLVLERALDLDGDGHEDLFASHPHFCASAGCRYQTYVVRGACAHFVGEVFATRPLTLATQHSGLFDLIVTQRRGCGGIARREMRLQFDGMRYVEVEARECRCPAGTFGDRPADDRSAEPDDLDATCEDWVGLPTSTVSGHER